MPGSQNPKPSSSQPRDPPEVLARVNEGMELVSVLATQMRRLLGTLDEDELRAYGREALLHAARSFDPTRGVPFRRWANLRIRGGMIDAVRRHGDLPRRVYKQLRAIEASDRVQDAMLEEDAAAPPHDAPAADGRLDDYLVAMATAYAAASSGPPASDHELESVEDPGDTPEEALSRARMMASIRAAIASRPEAERRLIERHYVEGITFEQAAAELGLSKSWASRLHARAIEAIARELKREKIAR